MKTFMDFINEGEKEDQDARRRADLNIGTGIFSEEFARSLEKMDIKEAKEKCLAEIEKSTARPENKEKAVEMVKKAKNSLALMTGVYNFMLSWTGEKLIK